MNKFLKRYLPTTRSARASLLIMGGLLMLRTPAHAMEEERFDNVADGLRYIQIRVVNKTKYPIESLQLSYENVIEPGDTRMHDCFEFMKLEEWAPNDFRLANFPNHRDLESGFLRFEESQRQVSVTVCYGGRWHLGCKGTYDLYSKAAGECSTSTYAISLKIIDNPSDTKMPVGVKGKLKTCKSGEAVPPVPLRQSAPGNYCFTNDRDILTEIPLKRINCDSDLFAEAGDSKNWTMEYFKASAARHNQRMLEGVHEYMLRAAIKHPLPHPLIDNVEIREELFEFFKERWLVTVPDTFHNIYARVTKLMDDAWIATLHSQLVANGFEFEMK